MHEITLHCRPTCTCIKQTFINCLFNLNTFLELKAQYSDKKIKISSELYKKGCVSTIEEGLASAQKIGFPVMIKASEGGGGKGIRKVETSEDFPNLFRQVCSDFRKFILFIRKIKKF